MTRGAGVLDALPHPKVRARRIEVRRDEGRRRRRRLGVLAAVLGVAALAAGATRSPVLDVDRISVVGGSRTSTASVVQASGLATGDAMVQVDGGATARRIEELPWVERASVQRIWPSTVRVRVTERIPVAQAALAAGGWALLDAEGRVLDVVPQLTGSLVRMEGALPGAPGSQLAPAARPALAVADALPPRTAALVAAVRMAGAEIELVLHAGAVVRMGPPADTDAKLVALQTLLDNAPPDPPIRTIDVRVPSAPVLTRDQVLTTENDDA